MQVDDKKTKKLRSEGLSEGWKEIKQMFHYQGLLYILKVIHSELISRYHNDLFADHFGIEKTQELIVRKYHWPLL